MQRRVGFRRGGPWDCLEEDKAAPREPWSWGEANSLAREQATPAAPCESSALRGTAGLVMAGRSSVCGPGALPGLLLRVSAVVRLSLSPMAGLPLCLSLFPLLAQTAMGAWLSQQQRISHRSGGWQVLGHSSG